MRTLPAGPLAAVLLVLSGLPASAQQTFIVTERAPGPVARRVIVLPRRTLVQPAASPYASPGYSGTVGVMPGGLRFNPGMSQPALVGPGLQPSLVGPGMQPSLLGSGTTSGSAFLPSVSPAFVREPVQPLVPLPQFTELAAPPPLVPTGQTAAPANALPPTGVPSASPPLPQGRLRETPAFRGDRPPGRAAGGAAAAAELPLASLFSPEVLAGLHLTEGQQRRLQDLRRRAGEQDEQLRSLAGGDRAAALRRLQELRTRAVAEANGVLTDSQRRTWARLTGQPSVAVPQFATTAR